MHENQVNSTFWKRPRTVFLHVSVVIYLHGTKCQKVVYISENSLDSCIFQIVFDVLLAAWYKSQNCGAT